MKDSLLINGTLALMALLLLGAAIYFIIEARKKLAKNKRKRT